MYDVAIVGGGPAGSTLGYRLARRGLKVVLLEKARYPRPKPCGSALDAVFFAHLPEELRAPLGASVVEAWVRGFNIQDGRDARFLPIPQALAMSSREKLDEWLARQAEKAGCEVVEGFRVEDVAWPATRSAALLTAEDFRFVDAEVVVAADGVYSVLAEKMGLGRPRSAYALTDWFVYAPPDVRRAYDGYAVIDMLPFPEIGYGWVFPKGDHLSVGIGTMRRRGKGLAARTRSYLTEKGLDGYPLKKQGHWLVFAQPGAKFVSGRVLAVGDAGGLADPGSGGGIGWAVWSAELADQAIAAWFATGRSLAWYQEAVDKTIMRRFRTAEALRNNILLAHALRRGPASSLWEQSAASIFGGSDYLQEFPGGLRHALGRALQRLVVSPLIERPGTI